VEFENDLLREKIQESHDDQHLLTRYRCYRITHARTTGTGSSQQITSLLYCLQIVRYYRMIYA